MRRAGLFLSFWLAAGLGAAPPSPVPTPGPTRQFTLPILCYHRFAKEPKDSLSISTQRFTDQLRWLKKEGYQSITLEQARQFIAGKGSGLPLKPVIISIDDGYGSGWTVAGPILKRFGFKAVYFVIVDQVGAAKNFLDWDDLKDILAAGHEIGSHTMDHTILAKPIKIHVRPNGDAEGELKDDYDRKTISRLECPSEYITRMRYELETSRKRLEEKLGIPIKTLAYPFGAYNPVVESYAVDAGYDLIMSVSGGVNVPLDNPLRVRRILIMGHPNLASFKKKILEQRALAVVEGVTEGMGVAIEELPLKLKVWMADAAHEVPRAEIQSHWMKLEKEGGNWVGLVPKDTKPGFYFFKIETGEKDSFRRDSYLFQIYKKGWKPYMVPLSPSAQALSTTAKPKPQGSHDH